MATRERKKKLREGPEPEPRLSDWAALGQHAKENPLLAATAGAVIVLCGLAALIYWASASAGDRRTTTEYAEAVANEDPALRAAQLAPLTETAHRWTPEALYMMGEAAFQARDYARAKDAFERVREVYPDAAFAPDAVEGLGNIAENDGEYEKAIALYQEVTANWPDSFAGIRQDLSIARCQERLGNFAEAVKAYESQVELFPDSSVAGEAERALTRLRSTHPDLFPDEAAEEETPDAEAALETGPSETIPAPVVDDAELSPPTEGPAPEASPSTGPAEEGAADDTTATVPPAESATQEAPPKDDTE